MNGSVRESGPAGARVTTVSFAERFATSAAFDAVYKDGMSLVEETASYLDGAGRKDAKGLTGPKGGGALTLAYATESMRLTTRLMQLASWLLIRKAVNDGEMSREDAVTERRKVRFNSVGRPSHNKDFEALPARLRSLVERSFTLHDQIARLDQVISGEPAQTAPSVPAVQAATSQPGSIGSQHQLLDAAFNVHHLAKPYPHS
jgi:regulator of CtrA degradation